MNPYLLGAIAGWVASAEGHQREVELLSLFVFGPLALHAMNIDPRPDWARRFLAASGAAGLTYQGIRMLREGPA